MYQEEIALLCTRQDFDQWGDMHMGLPCHYGSLETL